MKYHTSVLLDEAVAALNIQSNGIYVDATFGGGGHSAEILKKLGPQGKLLVFDQDLAARNNLPDDKRITFIHANFRDVTPFLRLNGVKTVHGILADLGVSSHQLDESERGFSYRFESELDMRMNRELGKTAADILNSEDANSLQDILSRFGEVRNAKTLAHAIVQARQKKPIRQTSDLVSILEPLVIGNKMRYFSQVFQALRMKVNDEIGALEDFLKCTLQLLEPGGRLAIITFHSLEDRMVKNFMKSGNVTGEMVTDFFGNIERPFHLVTKKAVEPSVEEVRANPRSRSAKLRVAEKIG